MEGFTPEQFISFLGRVEKLKSVPRHCVTSDGVTENVAAHSWRTALMAYLLKGELVDVDIDKVIRMCLIHDLGEAVTGDIPTFEKTQEHEQTEKEALDGLLLELPESLYQEFTALLAEMQALQTREARVYKALDKLEAVIQHNESDISTWLPLEYELQKTYAAKSVLGFPFLEKLQQQVLEDTERKIREEHK
ncbi:MAG TPA: HD domain-containing protein [Candidatus Eisenbergiella merdipullorum]|uniref:5'-deoxynucleotidase n=1 Tax=Candidatus Eisenbergiella merdipullorum TaxID=2838553 RepID=A0A9D2L0B3_9FIRM|nr:HD domain-containing protein [Candidatus Eisenbergiella merdipullorum]